MIYKKIPLFFFLLVFISCERDWISNQFVSPDGSISRETERGKETIKEEPLTIKNTEPQKNVRFNPLEHLVFAIGDNDDEIGIYEGGEDEIPTGPMSFTVDDLGNILILDNINGWIKGFDQRKSLTKKISLGEKAKGILDISINKDGQIVIADMAESSVYLLSSNVTDIFQPLKKYHFNVPDFAGIFTTNRGHIHLRYGNQQSLKLNESGINVPIMSLISRNENMFLRTKKISGNLAMLFMSSREQNPEYKGNTEKQIEIIIDRPILSISYIDTDKNDRVYLLVEADDGSNETIKVKRYVIRTGAKAGDWSRPVEIPLDIYAFPFKDIVIGNDGTIYALLVYKDRIEVAKWKAE